MSIDSSSAAGNSKVGWAGKWGCRCLFPAALFFFTLSAASVPTNTLSDAEFQGRALVQKILVQVPTENYTNVGVLEIRGAGPRVRVPVEFDVVVGRPWKARYTARTTNAAPGREFFEQLTVTHPAEQPGIYEVARGSGPAAAGTAALSLTNNQIMVPFARSDFWLADLGLEFFHWPDQRIVKKEFHRQCPCTVLESRNPDPATGTYSRVVCWIDNDSLGIVEAYAYDLGGKRLKNFYPKNLQKVNGQYQVESMVMENLQTGSKSVLEFDLNK